MKRSRKVALISMGISALALSACSEQQNDAAIFTSLEECIAGKTVPKAQCESAFKAAKSQHASVAPKYKNKEECEADMGVGKCETSPYRTQSGSSVWMPLMAGYMMGRVLGGGGVHPQPLYRSRDDNKNFRTADNKSVGGAVGAVRVAKSATAPPAKKFFTSSRGGFGSSARSYGASRFGG